MKENIPNSEAKESINIDLITMKGYLEQHTQNIDLNKTLKNFLTLQDACAKAANLAEQEKTALMSTVGQKQTDATKQAQAAKVAADEAEKILTPLTQSSTIKMTLQSSTIKNTLLELSIKNYLIPYSEGRDSKTDILQLIQEVKTVENIESDHPSHEESEADNLFANFHDYITQSGKQSEEDYMSQRLQIRHTSPSKSAEDNLDSTPRQSDDLLDYKVSKPIYKDKKNFNSTIHIIYKAIEYELNQINDQEMHRQLTTEAINESIKWVQDNREELTIIEKNGGLSIKQHALLMAWYCSPKNNLTNTQAKPDQEEEQNTIEANKLAKLILDLDDTVEHNRAAEILALAKVVLQTTKFGKETDEIQQTAQTVMEQAEKANQLEVDAQKAKEAATEAVQALNDVEKIIALNQEINDRYETISQQGNMNISLTPDAIDTSIQWVKKHKNTLEIAASKGVCVKDCALLVAISTTYNSVKNHNHQDKSGGLYDRILQALNPPLKDEYVDTRAQIIHGSNTPPIQEEDITEPDTGDDSDTSSITSDNNVPSVNELKTTKDILRSTPLPPTQTNSGSPIEQVFTKAFATFSSKHKIPKSNENSTQSDEWESEDKPKPGQ